MDAAGVGQEAKLRRGSSQMEREVKTVLSDTCGVQGVRCVIFHRKANLRVIEKEMQNHAFPPLPLDALC